MQRRLMRTYRVELLDPTVGPVNRADVNLSFAVDGDCNPVDEHGRPVGDVTAYAELTKRLRKLAQTKRVAVTTAELNDDRLTWAVKIVRWRFVDVDDANLGCPARKES